MEGEIVPGDVRFSDNLAIRGNGFNEVHTLENEQNQNPSPLFNSQK